MAVTLSDDRRMQEGSSIMLFVKQSGSYKSVAHASSHTLSLSAETEDITTKDIDRFGKTEISRITWEISVDSFYTNEGYGLFFDAMYNKTELVVCFGLKAETGANDPTEINTEASGDGDWTPASANVYYGNVLITNLDWTADAGSKSTFSATLAGQGELSSTAPV